MKERERTTNARALPFMIVVKVMVGVEGCTGVKVALTMSTGKTGAPDAKGRCCCVMAAAERLGKNSGKRNVQVMGWQQ
jgi:hypothetical protein